MDNETTMVVDQESSSFLADNIVPFMVTTGCLTIGLLGTLLAVRTESKNRIEKERLAAVAEAAAAAKAAKNAIVDRNKYPGGKLTVYFATQTGTAESFAKELEREAKDHGFLVRVEDAEDIKSPEHMADRQSRAPFGADSKPDEMPRAIVLAATYGEGEPTDNATELVNQMEASILADEGEPQKQKQKRKPLLGLEYAVFGLGNTEYEIFNAMGKFFDATMERLGGNRVYELGLGDDSDDLEADFEKWKEGMWAALKKRYVKEGAVLMGAAAAAAEDDKRSLPDCEYAIRWEEGSSTSTTSTTTGTTNSDENRSSVPLETVYGSSKHYFTAVDCPVDVVRELRSPEDGGSTVHVEIDISNADMNYRTADNLGVLPCNAPEVVESVAESLGYTRQLDNAFTVAAGTNQDGEQHEWHGLPFPTPITLRECLTRYLDLTSAPRRSDLKLLSSYAKQPLDRKALQRLSSKEGKQEYKEKIVEAKVGLVQLLKLCPSLEIPLEHLIGNVCRFQLPRFYTISSCPKVHPNSIHLTVAITKEERPDGSMFDGVCSTHIAQALNQSLRVFVRPSTFRLPSDTSTPVLMIGPGTGIAPMRAFLQDRRHQFQKEQGDSMHNVLYFGCKKEELDYIYREELEEYHREGVLKDLHLAFSRKDPGQKEYVQHLLRKNASSTYQLLKEQGAYVFVCGGVKMGHDVTETLKEILVQESNGSVSPEAAAMYLSKLSSEGRFVQELWS
mmetsp:Transcript_14447/g.40207  ORF Transcript_14447/g.40207 Transcript_14447/m.40207 type:complete len:731 (+) Transcript_14447:436-2628(+)